uniref:Uncharacterized protein n=1 Tax=Glossina pallidipes TaxID=7398 RepID=A0A1A9ZF02_GLOPL
MAAHFSSYIQIDRFFNGGGGGGGGSDSAYPTVLLLKLTTLPPNATSDRGEVQGLLKKLEMSMSSPLTPVNIRICLVGEVAEDESCCEAARTFGVPVVTSGTGLDLINDYTWRTHFVLKDFETSLYSAIHKSKQCFCQHTCYR